MSSEPVLDDASDVLNTPLLELGDVAITPPLLLQVVLFSLTLILCPRSFGAGS